jgi:acyl-CoA synthetase (AMP-forming)/AMP-acid ligase II
MFQQFARLAAAAPGAPAVIDGETGRVTTRSALLRRAEELADQLRKAGLHERDLVAVQLPNSVDFVAAFLAVAKENLIAVPIDRDAPETEVGAILSHFAVRALVYRSGGTQISTRSVRELAAVPPGARLIKLTSGSTGKPKGIVASEENLFADCRNICLTMEIAPYDINFGAIPLSHSYGFSNLVTPLITQGTALVISNDYLPQSIIDRCNRHRCTVLPAIPMVFDHLSGTDRSAGSFTTVRTFISAGAPLAPSTSRRFRGRFGHSIHSFYGCSECGGITYDRQGAAVERGTVGGPMLGVTLSQRGARLVIEGDSVALGYLSEASDFRAHDAGRFVADDLVEIRDNGEVALIGRASDLINTAGKKVNPREVEQVILQMEGVRQAKVYGEPAGARGEVVAAAIVANPDVTREQVRQFCRTRLSTHKVPRIVKLIDAIPVDERGKVKRAALAEL